MDLELADDQRLIQESVRRFAAAEVRPGAKERDHRGTAARELFPRLGELGLFELLAAGLKSLVIAVEELARQDASLALIVALSNTQRDAWIEGGGPVALGTVAERTVVVEGSRAYAAKGLSSNDCAGMLGLRSAGFAEVRAER